MIIAYGRVKVIINYIHYLFNYAPHIQINTYYNSLFYILSDMDSSNHQDNKEPDVVINKFNKNDFFHSQNPDFEESTQPIGLKSSEKDIEEEKHLKSIIAAFLNYQVDTLREVSRMERDFESINQIYKDKMKFNYTERIEKIKKAIWQNYTFLLLIAQPYKSMFKMFKASTNEVLIEPLFVKPNDIIKLRSTLKLYIRDWSIEGEKEREMCYAPILSELQRYFPNREEYVKGISVLVPGAGLGRLMYEIAKLGFKSQGNEFSYFMLLCSDYILNKTTDKNEYVIQPLIHSFSNVYKEDSPFKLISIPDESLFEELSKTETGEMSMVAGEFVRVYKSQVGVWNSVVTCFFIDTANNIIEYIETIHLILKQGGVWINLGPLLYHYTEIESECSIELSWEELKHIILKYGFRIEKEEDRECTYSTVQDSMMKTIYRCIFFIAIKEK